MKTVSINLSFLLHTETLYTILKLFRTFFFFLEHSFEDISEPTRNYGVFLNFPEHSRRFLNLLEHSVTFQNIIIQSGTCYSFLFQILKPSGTDSLLLFIFIK
jgi:hypothetical protein